jgi:hypothetical protein
MRRLCLLALVIAAPAAAQVDPSGTWRTLHTEHFRIHFRPTYRVIAFQAAREAERAYQLLASELHSPRGVVDLTLGDDTDAPNGFATVYPSNRVTIFLPPPVADPALQNYDSWLRLVIVHELTHVFHLDRTRGLWSGLQQVFGRAPGLFPNEYQPAWVVEGLATYYESRFTGAGRADGSFQRQVVAADRAAGTARTPWEALYFTRWPAGLGPYAYGSRFFDDLSRTTGDSLVPRFVERTAGQLIPYRVGRQLRIAGAPRALSADWARAIERAAPADSSDTAQSRTIVGGLRSAPVPRVSPDRRRVAYLYDDGRGARRLRVVDAGDWRVLRSHRVTGQVSYDWLGDTLVVAQLGFTGRWRLRSDLYRWTPDGAWRRTTRGARLIEPRTGGGILSALAVSPGHDAPTLPGVSDSPGTTWGAVVPSADGRWVAATRHQNGHWGLVRWPRAAPESLAVLIEAPPAGVITDPSWTPAGDLLFVTEVAGFPQAHLWAEGRGVLQVTAVPLGARAPTVLADGTLLFTALGGAGWELRTTRPLALAAVAPGAAESFDSAPPLTNPPRETAYAEFASLRPHFWIPDAFDAAQTGSFLGALTSGTDAVGRYVYVAEGLVSAAPLRAQGALVVVTHALGNPSLDASVSNDWSHVGVTTSGHVVSAAGRDAALGATFVARSWRSYLSLRLAAEYEGTRYVVAPDTALAAVCLGCRHRDLVGGSAGLAFGSLVTAPLAVSPLEGFAVSLLYRRREEQGTARWSNETRARVALYARLGPRLGFAAPVLAVRVAAGASVGTIPAWFSVGGVSTGALYVGFGQTVGRTRTFPVRGYDGGALYGRRVASVAVEYRIPLALVGRSFGHLPFGADKVSLVLFGDAGDAWDPGEAARLHRLRSVGAELVGDLAVSYDVPLRLRLGLAQPAAGQRRVYAAFDADF